MSLPKSLHFHLHIQHWVVWWFYVGIVCGVVALTNVFLRNLSETQIKLVLVFGVLHWVLGGVICYCIDGVRIAPPPERVTPAPRAGVPLETEFHSASEFLLPGNHKSVLPPTYWRSRMIRGATHPPSAFPQSDASEPRRAS